MKNKNLRLKRVYLSDKDDFKTFKRTMLEVYHDMSNRLLSVISSNIKSDNLESVYLVDDNRIIGIAIYRFIGKIEHKYMHVLYHGIIINENEEYFESILLSKLNNKVRKGLIISIDDNMTIYPNYSILENHSFSIFNKKRHLITNCILENSKNLTSDIRKSYRFVYGSILTSIGFRQNDNFT